jgi:hypothetical protein
MRKAANPSGCAFPTHEELETKFRSQAVFLQMPLVVFDAWDVGDLENVENPIIGRISWPVYLLVVGRDVEEEVGRSLAGV